MLGLLGRRTSDVERIVLSHFHDDQVGSAAAVAQWSPSAVVVGRAGTPFIRGAEPGPWPALTTAEQALNPPVPGTVAPPPPCRVDHEAADGDVLDFADGAVVLHLDTVAGRDVDELIVGSGRSGVTIFLRSAGGPEMSMIRPGARRWGCGLPRRARGWAVNAPEIPVPHEPWSSALACWLGGRRAVQVT